MIVGVTKRALISHRDERGSLTEVLRSDWPDFVAFGQAIVTINLPGVVRAWHWHRQQTDVIVAISGTVLLPLYDGRPASSSFKQLEEHVSNEGDRFALFVPPGVYHGYKTLGPTSAVILNFPSHTYDPLLPDEERVPHDDAEIAYDWSSRG